jgi:hypothetical protein
VIDGVKGMEAALSQLVLCLPCFLLIIKMKAWYVLCLGLELIEGQIKDATIFLRKYYSLQFGRVVLIGLGQILKI